MASPSGEVSSAPSGAPLDNARPRLAKRYRTPLLLVLSTLVLATVAIYVWRLRTPPALTFVTQPVIRQTLVQSASATGTVNAQDTISVGSQVSGTISELLVDYNSRVRKGDILARIDPSTFRAQFDQASSAYAQAGAQNDVTRENALAAQRGVAVARANATSAAEQSAVAAKNLSVVREAITGADAAVLRTSSAASLAGRTLDRDRVLLREGYVSQSQFDSDRSALVAAASALENARMSARQARLQSSASASQARSSVAQHAAAEGQVRQTQAQADGSAASTRASAAGALAARSQLDQAQLNLDRSVIVSPVDGTVIARNVSVGQTIASSFAAPTLFTIAKDLKKMEVDIAVGEPDIGVIVRGAAVEFSVLAFPNVIFHSIASQVRENPTTIQNVVTYTVVSFVDNRDGRLRPGMTATATIRVAAVHDALVVPLQALAWRPTSRTAAGNAGSVTTSSSAWGKSDLGASGAVIAGSTGAVYVDRIGAPQRVAVRVDLVSGTQAAVSPRSGVLAVGDRIIVDTDHGTKR